MKTVSNYLSDKNEFDLSDSRTGIMVHFCQNIRRM